MNALAAASIKSILQFFLRRAGRSPWAQTQSQKASGQQAGDFVQAVFGGARTGTDVFVALGSGNHWSTPIKEVGSSTRKGAPHKFYIPRGNGKCREPHSRFRIFFGLGDMAFSLDFRANNFACRLISMILDSKKTC
jgi:hypothetical protein